MVKEHCSETSGFSLNARLCHCRKPKPPNNILPLVSKAENQRERRHPGASRTAAPWRTANELVLNGTEAGGL